MAKTAKDITSFKGGIVNTVEPSDNTGEDATGSFESVNTDGIQKQGVLKPRGTFVPYSPTYDGINVTDAVTGQGFHLMQYGYNYDTSEVVGTPITIPLTIADTTKYTLVNGGGTWVDALGNVISWERAAAGGGLSGSVTGYMSIQGTSNPAGTFTSGEVYRYEVNYLISDIFSKKAWFVLDPYCYSEAWGSTTINMASVINIGTGFFKSNGNYPRFTCIGQGTGSANDLDIRGVTFYKALIPGSYEYQFMNRQQGSDNIVEVYLQGGDADGTIGTPIETITMGPKGALASPSVNFLYANNALRLYDSDFNNIDNPNRYFGVQNEIFFKDCKSANGAEVSVLGEGASLQVRRYHWINEAAALTAPDARMCRVISNGDMRAAWAKVPTQVSTSDIAHHSYFTGEFFSSSLPYFIGLEYEVVKDGIGDGYITGTWNAAEDSESPTSQEKSVRYKFYVTFAYDDGAQESEMTQIKGCQIQGKHWQGEVSGTGPHAWDAINNDGFVFDHDYAHLSESLYDAPDTSDEGEIVLRFHDGSTGSEGIIQRFEDIGSQVWCVSPDHNLEKGYEVVISETTNFNGTEIINEVTKDKFLITDSSTPAVGEKGTFTWDGRYIARNAWDCAVNFKPFIKTAPNMPNGWALPDRAMGVNYYYSTSNDGHGKKYKLIDANFKEGIKFHSGEGSTYQPWKAWAIDMLEGAHPDCANLSYYTPYPWAYSHTTVVGDNPGGYVEFEDPPKIEDWDEIYGMKSDGWKDIRYKTAIIIGSQAYYGNVRIDNTDYNDRVLVSISNHGYDMIPDDNYLEVVPGDGDEIVLLLTYAQKLFVFKKRSLIVCTVGSEEDSVDATLQVGGIDLKSQACMTGDGIFWANTFGAFTHDGSELVKLTKDKIALAESNTDQIDIQVDGEALP